MNEEKMSRRRALKRFALWGGGLAAAGGFLGMVLDVWFAATRFSPAHWTELMALEELPARGTLPLYERKLALVLREGRIGAISLECTHLGCLVNWTEGGFHCPCHGSEFGPLGELWSGPAPRALAWHELRVRRGRLWAHTGRRQPEPSWLNLSRAGDEGQGHEGESHHG